MFMLSRGLWEMGSKSYAGFLCHYMLYVTLGHCLITVINIIYILTFLSLQMFVHDLRIFQSQYETCGLTLSAWYCRCVGHRLPGWMLPHTSQHRNRKSFSRPFHNPSLNGCAEWTTFWLCFLSAALSVQNGDGSLPGLQHRAPTAPILGDKREIMEIILSSQDERYLGNTSRSRWQ